MQPLRIQRRRPIALQVIIGLNIAVFLAWQFAETRPALLDFMISHFLISETHLRAGYVWTLVTSAFSHVDMNHALFNLFALWVFGRDLETIIGRLGFVHLYLAGAILSSLGHVAYQLAVGSQAPALGASGSVMAVAVVYAVLFPRARLLLFFILPVSAAIAVTGYVLIDILGLLTPNSGIAHAAHLGGAAYGLAYGWFRARPLLRRLLMRAAGRIE